MEFEFDQFKLTSQEPYLKLKDNKQLLYKISELRDPTKQFTLMMMDGNQQSHSEQLRIHLQCQSFTKGVVSVKGFKELSSTDSFGFKVERTGWLVQEIETTLQNICSEMERNNANQQDLNIRSNPQVQQFLVEASSTLAELQQENVQVAGLNFSSFVFTQTKNFKILDLSTAINVIGCQASVSRQILGNPFYYDPETYRASLQGDVFTMQNYYKSSVYALGLIVLEFGTMKPLDRRLTIIEINERVDKLRQLYGYGIADTLTQMLAPMRADRPDCVELKYFIDCVQVIPQPPKLLQISNGKQDSPPKLLLISNEKLDSPPKLLFMGSGKQDSVNLSFTNSFAVSDMQYTQDKEKVLTMQSQESAIKKNMNFFNSGIQFCNSELVCTQNLNQQLLGQSENLLEEAEFKMGQSQIIGQSQGDQIPKINTVHLSESLRKKIKQYQQARNHDKPNEQPQNHSQLGQGSSRNDFFEDESSDYIDQDDSVNHISLEQLQEALSTVDCLPFVDVNKIKIDRDKMLGKGTEGVVYLCQFEQCHNLAVKILQDIDNQSALDILLTTSQVQSKGFKGIFSYDYYAIEPSKSFLGLGDLRCNLYMISRRMRCDLGYANRELKMSDKEKIFICIQIATVLNELENVVIHGDIKPSNILLDTEFNISVIDFGMSRILSKTRNHLVESASHTYLYSPPEQVMHRTAHTKSDIWSFGIIIFELFSQTLITEDLIYEMGMYDENRKGSLKYTNPQKTNISNQQIYQLVDQMTQFDYETRIPPKKILTILQTIEKVQQSNAIMQKPKMLQNQSQAQSSIEQVRFSSKNKIKKGSQQKKGIDSSSSSFLVQGKQIKCFTPEPRNQIQQTAQTHINKKEHKIEQQYPTQVTKK